MAPGTERLGVVCAWTALCDSAKMMVARTRRAKIAAGILARCIGVFPFQYSTCHSVVVGEIFSFFNAPRRCSM